MYDTVSLSEHEISYPEEVVWGNNNTCFLMNFSDSSMYREFSELNSASGKFKLLRVSVVEEYEYFATVVLYDNDRAVYFISVLIHWQSLLSFGFKVVYFSFIYITP